MSPELDHSEPSDPQADLSRQEAFVRLFVKHESMVLGFIITLVPTRDDALEILQEASVVAWRKFEEFQPGTDFLNWMCPIAEFKVRVFRSQRNRRLLQFDDDVVKCRHWLFIPPVVMARAADSRPPRGRCDTSSKLPDNTG